MSTIPAFSPDYVYFTIADALSKSRINYERVSTQAGYTECELKYKGADETLKASMAGGIATVLFTSAGLAPAVGTVGHQLLKRQPQDGIVVPGQKDSSPAQAAEANSSLSSGSPVSSRWSTETGFSTPLGSVAGSSTSSRRTSSSGDLSRVSTGSQSVRSQSPQANDAGKRSEERDSSVQNPPTSASSAGNADVRSSDIKKPKSVDWKALSIPLSMTLPGIGQSVGDMAGADYRHHAETANANAGLTGDLKEKVAQKTAALDSALQQAMQAYTNSN